MPARVPRCMSTQHPDNVTVPFFAERSDLGGEDEVTEAYYAYSHLGCDEQMWDVEGKEVDTYVVKKLLTRYDAYFGERILGEDLRLTLRVPNPTVERAEAKVLLETLESIPRSWDAARLFYGRDIPAPITEVIIPMCASWRCIERIYRYYRDFIYERQLKPFSEGDITIGEWIGTFLPEEISVIPLFEDHDHMLASADILGRYLEGKDFGHQRVFLARSDPAMNYGMVSAVLLNKIALARLARLAADRGIELYPILGVGSAPFRGNLAPGRIARVTAEYPSVHTFTIQSAFKYDNPAPEATAAIRELMERPTGPAQEIDEGRALDVIARYSAEFRRQVIELAPLINATAAHVPSRRKRKLHVGLFGYARSVEGVKLPRAISFTSSLYSLGLPPELLGLSALTADDSAFLASAYPGFAADIRDAARFRDPDSELMPPQVAEALKRLYLDDVDVDTEHARITSKMRTLVADGARDGGSELVVSAGQIRGFLG